MAFINDQKCIFWQIFKQRWRWFTRPTTRKIARIIFNTGTSAGRLDHLNIKLRALFYTLGFEKLVIGGEFGNAAFEFLFDLLAGLLQGWPRRHIMRIGENCDAIQFRIF